MVITLFKSEVALPFLIQSSVKKYKVLLFGIQ